jgi:iron-sulfur cluster assembly protein
MLILHLYTECKGMNQDILEITTKATQLLADHFKDKDKIPIRLFVKLGGCGIRSFGVALEKPKKSDAIFEIDGFQYIVNKVLLRNVQPIKVDSDGFGFRISGKGIAPHHGCGNCGFMCGDGNQCLGNCAACKLKCGHGRRNIGNKTKVS